MNPRQRRGVVLMALAGVGALVVFVMVLSYVGQVRDQIGSMTTVLQLQSDVPAFAPIDVAAVRRVEVPSKWSPDTFISDPARLNARVAATALPKGAYLQEGMLAPMPALAPGQQEVAIMIDAETGVAGEVTPGSVVDIYGTFQGQQGARTVTPPCAVRILSRVPVLKIGQLQTETKSGSQGGGSSVVPVTFALSPDNAMRLAYAESFAVKLRLALMGSITGALPKNNRQCAVPEVGK
jgi:pilus assembly protein CpaB